MIFGNSNEKNEPEDRKELMAEMELFCKGENFTAYDFLGCHQEGTGCVFRVWAPNAAKVWLIGEFTDWEQHRAAMEPIGYGIWEYYAPVAKKYQSYRYVIETCKGEFLYKSDPFATHAETRPYSASKVYFTDGYCWQDHLWLKNRSKQQGFDCPINIYEMHAGSWRRYPDGSFYDYQKLGEELIPYLLEMGFTHLELLPIAEHPLDGSWGYQTTGYFAPTSRYGTPHQLMELIDKLHQAGIGVIFDWTPAHFPKDDFGLYRFDGSPCYEDADPRKGEHPHWGSAIFDYAKGEVKSFLFSSAVNWIKNYHVDGLRVDAVASMLYLDYGRGEGQWTPNREGGSHNLEVIAFFQQLNRYLKQHYPDVLMMAEESTIFSQVTAPPEENGLGFDYKWNMGWMNDSLRYLKSDAIYRGGMQENMVHSLHYAFSERYILPLSHDEVVYLKGSLFGKAQGSRWEKFSNLRAYLAYMYFHPGKKLLFMGGELAQLREWSEERALDWQLLEEEPHQKYREFCKALFHFYRNTPALWQLDHSEEGFEWLSCDNTDQNVISFLRKDKEGNLLIMAANFSGLCLEHYRLGVPLRGQYREVFSTDDLAFGGSGRQNGKLYTRQIPFHGREYSIEMTMAPFSVRYFYKKAAKQNPKREV